ncbi:MAG: aldehyde dehydrogenase family protein, partial [Verrucomicrobia bacterium]|nr:aldehyde dehydrogenase family protein [Verrucomicrobiota bacterium]
KKEFAYGMAYLIRRLDENTAPENFLRHIAQFKTSSPLWKQEALRFSSACQKISGLSSAPRDSQDRTQPPHDLPADAPFSNEPPTNYSLAQNRKWAEQFTHLSPLRAIPLLSWQDIDHALEEAKGAPFPPVAPLFRRHRSELISLMMSEGKKVLTEADLEVDEAIDFLEYYPRSAALLHEDPEVSWCPLGSVVVLSPWNFPLAIPVGGIAAALAAGNAVLFKPAPETIVIGQRIVELFWEAGVPKTALHFIPCEEEPTGNLLISDPRVDAVILTGATATAQHFLKLRPHLPLFAETGGKNSMIISNMADQDQAISHLITSAFSHSGQKCSACSLAILHKELYDDPKFLLTLKEATASLPVGLQTDLATRIGPLIKPPQGALLKALTELEPGEQWLLKGRSIAPDLWSPSIKLCSQIDPIERFGPILCVVRAENLDHAIALANSTPYGLTSGIQSLDDREIERWRQKILAGNLYVNRSITGAICGRQPFGGCKASSFGPGAKAGGPHYVAQLMHPKQRQLPYFSASHPIEAVLSEEEIIPFRHSLGSYRHHWERLKAPRPLSDLVGESNTFYLVPREHVTIVANDNRLDIARALAAAEICGTKVSLQGTSSHPWSEFFRLCAPKRKTHLCLLPCLASGHYELLRYTREISLSKTTHRYGNLLEYDKNRSLS